VEDPVLYVLDPELLPEDVLVPVLVLAGEVEYVLLGELDEGEVEYVLLGVVLTL
jgi:hypothetical protein